MIRAKTGLNLCLKVAKLPEKRKIYRKRQNLPTEQEIEKRRNS